MTSHRAQFESMCPSGTRVVHVATTGNDSTGDGSPAAPYATLQKALDGATAGDKIMLAEGTYTAASNMYGKNGTSAKWITIQSADDESTVTLDGTGSSDGAGVLYFQQCSYFGVYGLEIKATKNETPSSMSGLAIFRGCHHGVIWQNRIHDVPSGGINCFWVPVNTEYSIPAGSHDVLDIGHNTIWNCANNDPNNSSGISIAEPMDITGGETWNDGYAYRIHHNYCFNNECLKDYTAGGLDYVTDGNGISIDAFAPSNHTGDVPNYYKPVLVEHNILTGNGGRGVHVHNAYNVTIRRNVGIGNLSTTGSPAISAGSEFDGDTDKTVVIDRNTIYPRNVDSWRTGPATFIENVILGGAQAVSGSNLDMTSAGYGWFTHTLNDADLITEQDVTAFNPASLLFPATQIYLNDELADAAIYVNASGTNVSASGAVRPALNPGGGFTIVGPGITDNGDGTWTADGSGIIDNEDGTWTSWQ